MTPRELRRLYETQRWSMQRIARHYRVARSRVRTALDEAGIPRRPPGSPARRLPDAQIVQLYVHEGWNLSELAERFEVEEGTIRRRLDAAGVPRRPRPAPNRGHDLPDREIVQLYVHEGWTGEQLAQHYQVSRGTIYRRLDAAHVPRRDRGRRPSGGTP